MLEKVIKKMHMKVAFSLYGILQIIVLLLPLIVIGFGIMFIFTENDKAVLWIIVGVFCLLFSFSKFKELFTNLKYIFNPQKYALYKNLIEEGIDVSIYDSELEEADIFNKLNKDNPILLTKNFIIGYSQISFFIILRDKLVWTYEYNGNGIVFYDMYKYYGYTFFKTVDGNDKFIEELKNEMPYIYYGTDFDYKVVMHDNFEETINQIKEERAIFLNDPESYRIKKAEEERIKAEEEAKKLEEEKEKELSEALNNSEFKEEIKEESNEENN